MTESHTQWSDPVVSLLLPGGQRATNSDSHSVCRCVQAQAHALLFEGQFMLLNYPALNLESLMHAHSRQSAVDVAVTTAEKVTISGAQVSVEKGVDERVH